MVALEPRYPLAREMIEALERAGPATGWAVYVLEAHRGSEYGVARVGLARRSLAEELGSYDPRRYPTFRYREYGSPAAAFAAVCRAYHEHGGEYGYLDNRTHPEPLAGVRDGCPVAGCPHPARPAAAP